MFTGDAIAMPLDNLQMKTSVFFDHHEYLIVKVFVIYKEFL